ncbi:MAG TPA: hypothetical protein PK205_02845 [Promineifilum sp.]|nr:hypothetical protein [Promineifilum sp.]HRO22975.1 hypothetical protein [Promineifilum sp.]HRO89034.1 hypothetical protein [Promineifilum sp.]HRQ12220.1 hypothetical protein [Promineifilum sp.]
MDKVVTDRLIRPIVVIFFAGFLLILAGLCIFVIVRGSVMWPVPVIVAVICVIMAQGIWRLKEWARLFTIFLLGVSLFIVPLAVAGYWWAQRIVPIADLLAIICACPPLVPLGLLLYWFLSNEEHFQ